MDQELYIDGNLIDLDVNDTTIAMTFQINDISDLSSRNGNYSNNFKIPFTINNDRLLEFVKNIVSTSRKPYEKLPAKFIDAGIEIISNGLAIIEEAQDSYSVTVYSGNTDFFTLIKGLKLADLDFSSLNHVWNVSNIINSRTNSSGYFYPIIDYNGALLTASPQQILCEKLYPAIFIHTLIEMIFDKQGWTIEGDILTNERYLKEFLAFSNEKFENPKLSDDVISEDQLEMHWACIPGSGFVNAGFGDPYAITPWSGTDNIGGPATFGQDGIPTNGVWGYYLRLDPAASIGIPNPTVGEFTGYAWKAKSTSKIKLSVRVSMDYVSGGIIPQLWKPYIYLFNKTKSTEINRYEADGSGAAQLIIANQGATNLTWTITEEFNVNDDDEIMMSLMVDTLGSGGCPFTIQISTTNFGADPVVAGLEFKAEYEQQLILGNLVEFKNHIPNMTQVEFLKGVMNQFCISPDANANTKTMLFRNFEELKTNLPYKKDWSAKKGKYINQKPKISYRAGNYFQKNDFKYQQDFGVTPLLGNSSFNISDDNLGPRGAVVELPFGASIQSNQIAIRNASLTIQHIPSINTDSSGGGKITPRVLIRRMANFGLPILYTDDLGNTTPISTDVPLCHFIKTGEINLDFDSLLADYWTAVTDTVKNAKFISVLINLKTIDLQSFDHFVPVYIEELGNDFYVNKINNYKRGKLTSVDLIRL